MDAGLLAHARLRPEQIALRLGDETRTYAELDDRARRVSQALHALGVRRGDRVAIMVPNSIEFFEAAHGAGRLGAIVVPVNMHFKSDEAGWVVADSGATAVVVAESLLPALDGVAEVPRLVVGDGYERALEQAPAGEVDAPDMIGDGWPTSMAYTSGTTGRPKGVAIGADDFRRRAEGVAAGGQRWGLGPDDVHLAVGPLYHSGPSYWAQMHLALGATVVIMARWDAAEALGIIERDGVTSTHMVPANFQRILALPAEIRERADLSSLKLVLHAAAPCPVPLKRAFMDFVGPEKVWEYYGASEGGGTVISPQEWLEHPGSVGKPFPGNEFVILDDDGNELPAGEVGTVWCNPAASSFEYHNDAEKTAASHRDRFFTVGDAGYLDADGYLYLTDRKSDMVITGGVNVYPREIEECLLGHDEIVDCAVLGIPDDEWGEVIYALVQPTPDAKLDEEAVVTYVREHMADYKRPRIVELVDELPRDPNGKVRKPKLRDAYLARRSGS
ncbi:MAG: AMP-binding protein [Acidimicrobiia bacterium]